MKIGTVLPDADCDAQAYALNSEMRWVYMKPLLYEALGVPYGLAPSLPDDGEYPVVVKPAINLYGLSLGAFLAESDHQIMSAPGCLWMPVLEGDHISADVTIEGNGISEIKAVKGSPHQTFGLFERWEVTEVTGLISEVCHRIRRVLRISAGNINIEMIGGIPIEVHLRHSDEYGPLYDGSRRIATPIFADNANANVDLEGAMSFLEHGMPEYAGVGRWRFGMRYS